VTRRRSIHPCDRILAVNHDLDLLDAIRRALEDEGIEVEIARPERAFEAVRRGFQPNAILLDVRLADGSEQDLLAAVKREPATAGVPVIVMSAFPVTLRQLAPDVDAVLEKPFDVQALYDLLAEFCARGPR
jgi:DNA-binding response OmpR family regulator